MLLSLCLAALAISCGGAAPRHTPAAATEEAPSTTETAETPREKARPDCSDGTCIRCGDAECPKGFFCDESGSTPNCQWVPACKEQVSCSCVKETLDPGCSCSERDDGTYVRCEK